MRLSVPQLATRLREQLAPIYLLSGEEPLQLGEAAQSLRQRARERGYLEREVIEAGPDFDWREVGATAASLSLFSERRLIEVRLSTSRIGTEGSRAVSALCTKPNPDVLFLLLAPKLERDQIASSWVSAIDRTGVVVQIWPVEGAALIPWLEQRLRAAGLEPQSGAAVLLAERVEGNLLAAAQEVEKLVLLYGEGPITAEQVRKQSTDSSRFDVFDLADAALAGSLERVPRILDSLRAEGLAAPVVLWALVRELRLLIQLGMGPRQGGGPLAGPAMIERRRPLYRAALQRHPRPRILGFLARCTDIDRQIKGQAAGDEWEALLGLSAEFAGATPLFVTEHRTAI